MDFAQYYQHYGPMMHDGGGSWIGAVLGMLFFIFFVLLIMYVVRSLATGHHHGHMNSRDPLDIAKERYAKGEITKEELTEIKKELK